MKTRLLPLILPSSLLLLPLLSPLIQVAEGTITLSTTGKQYHSRPASFGFNLEYGLQYVALVQAVEDDLHLCGGEVDLNDGQMHQEEQQRGLRAIPTSLTNLKTNPVGTSFSGNAMEMKQEDYDHDEGINLLQDEYEGNIDFPVDNLGTGGNYNNNRNVTQKKEIHVVPSHGVPVAILAKRGQCSYETKARIASQQTTPHGTVRFVIVYDNTAENGNHLITMMPKDDVDGSNGDGEHSGKSGHELWKEVGLVFVSYENGVDLHEFINTQPHHVKMQGGPRILIDGSDHWVFPPMDESAAGLAFLLMLFGCVCSLSLFLNTTFYGNGRNNDALNNDHHLFFLGPDGQISERNGAAAGGTSRRRGNGLRLLTMEEVETLPTREYCSSSGETSSDDNNSPPSSSLELRDKSDMPYLADENDHNDGDGDDLQQRDSSLCNAAACGNGNEDNDSSPRGGLCESLLPTKKEDPYFDHESCSICLDEYEPGEQIRVLPCQHTFHSNCIFPWLTERSPTCPLCKAMFEAVQYEEEGEENNDRERAAAATTEEEGGDEEEQQSVQTEASVSLSQTTLPPPLEDEPPIHRRSRRQQRQAERQNDRASRSSRRDSNDDTDATAAAADSSGNNVNDSTDEVAAAAVSPSNEAETASSSPGLRGRLWGLLGAAPAATSAPTNALEEPLLASDDGGNDNVV
eukprot:CAMPEP_0172317964 /NCGR_PEP_ID=MMETSP1058-20130122/33433_1 /TAXON_ID=83371 /ORGANISM="Detonula confervacea, Strain CCMP 353" /LENGTH=686 /DNA_ID=CAMNT_0013032661 /DNA_START=441 /DNA_END=2501 /DNA_ORIENTATION=-